MKLNIDPELEFCELGLDDIATSPFGESVDVWVLALPNGYCEKYATALDALRRKDKIIIDLSADQRFNSGGRTAFRRPRAAARACRAPRTLPTPAAMPRALRSD